MCVEIETENNKDLLLETVTEMLKLKNSIEHTIAPISQRYGLTPMQTAALHFISCNGESTVGSVFRELELNQGNASSMCKRLESDGFIMRRRSEDDERRVVLQVTERGRQAISSIERDSALIIQRPNIISREEKVQIMQSLNTIKKFAKRIRETLINNEERNTDA